jgi:glycerophosphoryl diester phosphodiesterase
MSAIEIVAHRGASYDAPENTQAAIALAWQQHADAAEIDIQLSRDGEIVVIHDGNTLRTTGVNREVAGSSWAELKALDAGRWKGRPFEGERIPTLEEVLAMIPAGKRLFIELKSAGNRASEDGILTPLAASLARAKTPAAPLVLIGFDYHLMQSAKQVFPQIEAMWLRGDEDLRAHKDGLALVDESIALCHAARLDGLDLSVGWLEQASCGRQVKAAGLKLCVYTVNDLVSASRAAHAGVDSITTDRPAWLREQLSSSGNKLT